MKALITGATGLIGRALVARLPLAQIVSRSPGRAAHALGRLAHGWSPMQGPPPRQALGEADVVIHLAGDPVAEGRWTAAKKERIRDSRLVGTRNLVDGLAGLESRPRVLVSASAVGYYGDRGDELLDEGAASGEEFLPEVCIEWEREAQRASALGMRVVCVRIGVVLASNGGALARMQTPFNMGVGGRLGSGTQWMPWVHLDDVVGLILHACGDESIEGAMNAVSPNPVTNADFTRALGRALRRPTFLTVPKTALRIAFGELSDVLMASQRVVPQVAARTGYRFAHPELDGALAAIYGGEDEEEVA
jgi:uncharacterized protein